jgi:hypothetical protein
VEAWADKACAPVYDPRDVPIGDKDGITLGMGMTEKQGGSDVRRNGTVAAPLQADGEYALVGHKWFFSAPMSDGWLVLAQAPGGLSCFLMPRRLPDGGKNAFRLMRLKDKLGDWANASGEVEFCNAWALRVGPEGRGVATIIEMVMLTRLDCMLGAAAQMRMALAQAIHHARHRHAFGRVLAEQPLMRNVLADLALEAEAALALAMRVARAVDAAPHDPRQAAFARVATAAGKYWLCKRAPAFVNEAQECLGGAGYVEESILPRLYRQAPLNSIWEGSGNIQCLDVLRALTQEPACLDALRAEFAAAGHLSRVVAGQAEALLAAFAGRQVDETTARLAVERLGLLLQAPNCWPRAVRRRRLSCAAGSKAARAGLRHAAGRHRCRHAARTRIAAMSTPPPELVPEAERADLIRVWKARRWMAVYRDGIRQAAFPVALGFAPEGTSANRATGARPKANTSSRGAIRAAVSTCRCGCRIRGRTMPGRHARGLDPGGDIMLHGTPPGRDGDWTQGCIAVSDAHVEWLWRHVAIGTRIVIVP